MLFHAAMIVVFIGLVFHGPASAQKIFRGGALKLAVDMEPASLDPIFGNAPGRDRMFYNTFSENLIYQDDNGQFHPMLAETWEISPDNKELLFKLRSGIVFHDGTPFNADAVKFNLDRNRDPNISKRSSSELTCIESVDVVSPDTVRLRLNKPFAPLLAVLAMEPGTMVSPQAVEKLGSDFARHPVGTGPFEFVSWSSGQIELKRFEKYWRNGDDGQPLPYLDKIIIRVIPNTAVKIVELKAANIHLADNIKVKDFNQIKKSPELRLVPSHRAVNMRLFFNLRDGSPFAGNVELRKAISHSIDRKALERVISKGYGFAKTCFEPPASWAFDKSIKGQEFDLESAKKHYKASAYNNPITLNIIQRDPDTQIAQVIQAMLKTAGIELKINIMERSAFISKMLAGDYEMMMGRAGLPRPDPHIELFNNLHSGGSRNYGGIVDSAMDRLLEDAAGVTNLEERKTLYKKVQELDLKNYYMVHLFGAPMTDVIREEVNGFKREYSGGWMISDIWLKQ